MAIGVGVAVAGKQSIISTSALTGPHEDFTLTSSSSVTQGVVTLSYSKGVGSNAPAWYAAGLRLYAKNTITITGTSNIVGVEFHWEKQGSKAFAGCTASTGSYTHPTTTGTGTWTGDAASVQFTLGSSGQLQLNTLSVYYASTDVEVTITGSTTVNEGSPVTYSCDAGVTATWTLENVNPTGCATISGSTVTAHQSGTAKLVCTPSTAGYTMSSVDLTLVASIKHNILAEGNYYIAVIPSYQATNSMLIPAAADKNPASGANDYSNATNSWLIEENENADDAYNIRNGNLYLEAINDSQGISIVDHSSTPYDESENYWTISKNGVDDNGNAKYLLHFSDGGNRFLGFYNNSYRYYASGDNINMNLIPASRTLTALAVGGTLTKSSYDQNDDFDPAGATVTGTYSNGYGDATVVYLDVTDDTELKWTPSKLTETGSVNVYAKIGEITSTNFFTVTVTAVAIPVTGVSLSPATYTFEYAEIDTTKQLTATITPDNASNKNVLWESSDTDVATVSSTGLVTAKGVGTATITVTTVNGGFTATSAITVNPFVGEYHKVTDQNKLYAGMKFVLAYETGNQVCGPMVSGKTFMDNETATISNGELSSDGEAVFTLGGTVGSWTLTTDEGLLYATAAKALAFDSVLTTADSEWNITITNGNVFITSNTSDYGTIKYNATSPRFLNYASGQANIQMYAADHDDNVFAWISNNLRMGDTALNTNEDTGACKESGNGYYLTAKATFALLTQAERDDFENNQGEKYTEALKRYKAWAVANNDAEPFDGETTVVSTLKASGAFGTAGSNDVATIVVIIAIASISAFGCLLILKKRKHQ